VRFNRHLGLQGEHAFLSPSSYHWVNYTPDRLAERWTTARAAAYGVAQHEYAQQEILAGRMSSHIGTLGQYINDCIHHKMQPEQILYYSENCFGTADAINFRYKTLRIFDLKTGVIPGSVHQLEIYAALFCLEYGKDPYDIQIELRIYQDGEISIFDADPDDIAFIMEKIKEFDMQIDQLKLEEAS
jgi:Protein of unknown function (DUF2800)